MKPVSSKEGFSDHAGRALWQVTGLQGGHGGDVWPHALLKVEPSTHGLSGVLGVLDLC